MKNLQNYNFLIGYKIIKLSTEQALVVSNKIMEYIKSVLIKEF
jgi:hypothetical protein